MRLRRPRGNDARLIGIIANLGARTGLVLRQEAWVSKEGERTSAHAYLAGHA